MVMSKDMGASASAETGSQATPEAAEGASSPNGFDPARGAEALRRIAQYTEVPLSDSNRAELRNAATFVEQHVRSAGIYAISASACFAPEEDDPVSYDGSMISWTFAANKDARVGAGIYRLRFVRILTPEERNNIPAQRKALAAIAMEARKGGDGETRLHPKDDSAGPQDIAQGNRS